MNVSKYCPVLIETTTQWLLRWKDEAGVVYVVSWADTRDKPQWTPWFYRETIVRTKAEAVP